MESKDRARFRVDIQSSTVFIRYIASPPNEIPYFDRETIYSGEFVTDYLITDTWVILVEETATYGPQCHRFPREQCGTIRIVQEEGPPVDPKRLLLEHPWLPDEETQEMLGRVGSLLDGIKQTLHQAPQRQGGGQ